MKLKKKEKYFWTVLILLILAFPFLFKSSYILNLAVVTGFFTFATLGLTLLLKADQVSLAQGTMFGLGAYVYAVLVTKFNVGSVLAIVAVVIACLVVGYLISAITIKLHHGYYTLATLALAKICVILAQNLSITGADQGLPNILPPSLLADSTGNQPSILKYYFLIWLLVLAAVFFLNNISGSWLGRSLSAIGTSQKASETTGINVFKIKTRISALSAVFAGIAGMLFAGFSSYISPEVTYLGISIDLLIMAVIGGGGTIGTVVASVIYSILPEALRSWGDLRLIILGIVVMLFIVFRAQGSSLKLFEKTNGQLRFALWKKQRRDYA